MKIAIYQPRVSYYVGGAEIIALEHAKFLALNKHRVTIITTRAAFIRKSRYFYSFCKANKEIKIDYIKVPKYLDWIYKKQAGTDWERWDLESLFLSGLTTPYFTNNKFDIIAVHNFLDALSIPMYKNVVVHLHGYPQQFNYLHKLGKYFCGNYIAVSKYVKKQWEQTLRLKNIFVVTNGIESQLFIPKSQIRKIYDVLYVGRFIPIKGINFLIQAISNLDIPDLKVAIVGVGPEKNTLILLAKKLGILNKITFLGYVSNQKLVDVYNSSKMVVLPSYDREGILTTMLEASSCSIPVITTTACSMKEFLKHKNNGILVRAKNVRDISQAIELLYKDEKLRLKLGQKARRDIIRQWDWRIKIKDLERIYEKISNHN